MNSYGTSLLISLTYDSVSNLVLTLLSVLFLRTKINRRHPIVLTLLLIFSNYRRHDPAFIIEQKATCFGLSTPSSGSG
jgi:general stress protein CsbA